MNAIINLGKLETINNVKISFLESQGSWVHYPKNMEVFVSDDGLNFKKVKQISLDEIKKVNGKIELHIDSQTTRFVKIMATNFGKIPDGLPGAGSNAWLFVDEIGVE